MTSRLVVLLAAVPVFAFAAPKKPQYEVTEMSIATATNRFTQGGQFSLKVAFDVTVNKRPAKMTLPEIKATCEVGGKRRTDTSSDLKRFDQVETGETVRIESSPFVMEGLAEEPGRCEVTVSAKQMFAGNVKLGTWCKDGGEVKVGACPK